MTTQEDTRNSDPTLDNEIEPHLDQALQDTHVEEYEDTVELWKTYGGD